MSVTAPSYMQLFAQMREEAIAEAVIRVPVPITKGRDPEVWVEFDPIPIDTISAGMKKLKDAEKRGAQAMAHASLAQNIALMVRACRRLWMQFEDGTEVPLHPDLDKFDGWTRFDPDTAAFLRGGGVQLPENETASDVLKALFVRDGDVMSTADLVMKRSGYREQEVDEDLAGK